MTLNEFLTRNNLTDAEFAGLVQRDRTTIMRWRKGKTQPDWNGMQAIVVATAGAVTPNDFLPTAAPRLEPTEAAE